MAVREATSSILKPQYYEVESYQSKWALPERYQDLVPLGVGAFGTVW